MFTKTQLEIIRGVSTVLFQEVVYGQKPGIREYKRTENTHDDRQKGHYFEVDGIRHGLYVIDIDGRECLGLDVFEYGEYGDLEDVKTLGYVVLDKPERDQWEMYRYCAAIERILELGC